MTRNALKKFNKDNYSVHITALSRCDVATKSCTAADYPTAMEWATKTIKELADEGFGTVEILQITHHTSV